jgi:hypothetical protein
MSTLDSDVAKLVNAYADGDDDTYTEVTFKYLYGDDGMTDDLVAKLVDVLVEQLDGVRLSFPDHPDYDPPVDDRDTFCPMCGPPPCRHKDR